MAIEVYALSAGSGESSTLQLDDKKMISVLGDAEESLAVKLKDLFNSVIESISGDIKEESQINIEVSGSIDLKVKAGVKYLFFNVGGEASNTGTMKVSLSTTIKPA